MAEKLNIYQKLSKVREVVPYLKKEKEGKQFNYVGSSDVLGSLHAEINQQGLILVPQIVGHKVTEGTTKTGTVNIFTEIDMMMTWVNIDDPTDKLECSWYAQGMDLAGEKGVGKALTYGEKYFMLKFFNIATDKDDPDSFQGRIDSKKPQEPPKEATGEQLKIASEKMQLFAKMQGMGINEVIPIVFNFLGIKNAIAHLSERECSDLINYVEDKLTEGSK